MRNFTLVLLVVLGLLIATPSFAGGLQTNQPGDSSVVTSVFDWFEGLWIKWQAPVDKNDGNGDSNDGTPDPADGDDPNAPGQQAAGELAPNG